MNLRDKVVIITGGNKGIGNAAAQLFVEEAAKVVIVGRNQKDIDKTLSELGENAIGVKADVRHINQIERVASYALKTFGKIDILINNAGVFHHGVFLKQPDELWQEEVDTNIKGMLNCTKVVAPYMVRQKDGIIINISSGAGKEGRMEYATYSATKSAVLGFTQGFAEEVSPYNVRVYAVCPGMTKTQMTGFVGMPTEKVAKRILETAKETLGLSPGEDTEIYY